MSLEQIIEQNTAVLTELNANILRLLAGNTLSAHIAPNKPKPAPTKEPAPKIEKTVPETDRASIIRGLDNHQVAALAVLFGNACDFTDEQIKEADALLALPKDTIPRTQANCLYMAAAGVKNAQPGVLNRPTLLQLYNQVLANWEYIDGKAEREEFIKKWLDTPTAERAALNVKRPTEQKQDRLPEDIFEDAKKALLELAKSDRQIVYEILEPYGVSKLSDTNQDDWPAILETAQIKLRGIQ